MPCDASCLSSCRPHCGRLFLFLMIRRPPRSTLFPTRRSSDLLVSMAACNLRRLFLLRRVPLGLPFLGWLLGRRPPLRLLSLRLGLLALPPRGGGGGGGGAGGAVFGRRGGRGPFSAPPPLRPAPPPAPAP